MNEAKRNIVISWWDEKSLNNRLNIYDVKDQKNDLNSRFPHLVFVDSIKDIDRKEGFILLTCLDEFPTIQEYIDYLDPTHYCDDQEPAMDFYEFDRLNRKKFKNFEYVIIVSIDDYDFLKPKKLDYSNIIFYDEMSFSSDENIIYKLYQEYLNNKDKKLSDIKLRNIKRLKEYLDGTKKDYYSTSEIMNSLNVSDKWVQRYMKDMNYLYNNIGYNYRIKKWYLVK